MKLKSITRLERVIANSSRKDKTKRFHVLLADHARRVVKLMVLAFAFAQMASAANTYYVATNGPGGGATTWVTAKSNIQDAISLCSSGDVVWVSNGTYQAGGVASWPAGMVLTNRIAITNAITVRSANNNPTNTIIRGAWSPAGISNCGPDAVRCVYMANGSSLIGFMLTNGASMTGVNADVVDTYAGGVWSQSTNTVISNCVIAGNWSYFLGAGAYKGTLYNCTLIGNAVRPIDTGGGGGAYHSTLYNCTLITNYASYAGGARNCILYNCTLINNQGSVGGGVMGGTLSNCTLIGNYAENAGGGAYEGTLYNCTLINNISSSCGGGTYGGILSNCTLIGNTAGYGGGIYGGTSINSIIYFNAATIDGSDWYNAVVVFSNSFASSNQVDWVPGNITANPMFVDTNSGNYRLSAGSPCINTHSNLPQQWWEWLGGEIIAELNVPKIAALTKEIDDKLITLSSPWRLMRGAFKFAHENSFTGSSSFQTTNSISMQSGILSNSPVILEAAEPTTLYAHVPNGQEYSVIAEVMMGSGKPIRLSAADELGNWRWKTGYEVAIRGEKEKKDRIMMQCAEHLMDEQSAAGASGISLASKWPIMEKGKVHQAVLWLQLDLKRVASFGWESLPKEKIEENYEALKKKEVAPYRAWDEQWIRLRIDLTRRQVCMWADGLLVGSMDRPDLKGGCCLQLNQGDFVRMMRVIRLPRAAEGYLPLDITARCNNDGLQGGNLGDGYAFPATNLPPSDQYISVDSIPFYWPAAPGRSNNLDISRATVTMQDLFRYFRLGAFAGDTRRVLLRVPRRQFNQLFLIAAADSRIRMTDGIVVRMIKPEIAHYLDAEAQIPRWNGAGNEYTVKPLPVGPMWRGGTSSAKKGQLWLIRIPLDPGAFQGFLGDEKETALTYCQGFLYDEKETALTIDLTSPNDGKMGSGVHIFAATLGEPAVELKVTSDEIGHIFVQPQTPAFNMILKNQTPNTQTGRLDIVVNDFYDTTNRYSAAYAVPGWGVLTNTISMPCNVRGLHYLDVRLLDAHEALLVRRQTTFAVLPPDTRQADRDSPFGMWTYNADHYGGGKEASSALLSKVGARWAHVHSDPEKKIYSAFLSPFITFGYTTISQSNSNNKTFIKDDKTFLEKCEPFLSVGYWNVFWEDALGDDRDPKSEERNAATFPPELLENPAPLELTAAENAKFKIFWDRAVEFSALARKYYPEKPLIFGNGYPRFIHAFLARGYPRKFIDGFGLDFTGDRMNMFFYLREVARHYGYGDVPLYITEGFCTGSDRGYFPGKQSELKQADTYINAFLRGFAIGIVAYLGTPGIWDNGGTYYYTGYGPVGLCRRAPELNPKPAYVAYGTMTLLLDRAKFHSVVPTGSLCAYLLCFEGPRGLVYAAWTTGGERSLSFKTEKAKPRLTDSQCNSRPIPRHARKFRMTISPMPVWIEDAGVISDVKVEDPIYDSSPAPNAKMLYAFNNAEDWVQETNTYAAIEAHNHNRPVKQSAFQLGITEGRRSGDKALSVTLGDDPKVSPHRLCYTVLKPGRNIVIDRDTSALGVWIYGNGAAKLDMEVRDANGEVWHTVPPVGAYGFGMYYGEAHAFDGWKYITYPWTQWRHSSSGRLAQYDRLAFPLTLSALILEQYRQVVYVNKLAAPRSPTWRIDSLWSERDAVVSRAAGTYYVATNGPGGSATNWVTAKNNIQDAIDLCSAGDMVLVSNGVYEVGGVADCPTDTSFCTNRVAIYKPIIVRSANNDPANTIIRGAWASDGTTNGPDAVRCVYMADNSSLIGFMLTNGASMTGVNADVVDTYAGGVLSESTSAVISNCIIAGNRSYYGAAGAYKGTLYNCTLIGNRVRPVNTGGGGGALESTLYNCSLISNYAYYAGGARNCILYNCTLIDNGREGDGIGGGVMGGTHYNCTFIGNKADYGGGAYESTLYNCTLISNIALSIGGGADLGILSNCTLIGNTARYGGGANGAWLYNCLLIGNSATDGGGGGARDCSLYNCTVANNNSASLGGGISGGTSINSIIYFNTATTGGSNWYGAVVFTNSCTSSNQVDWVLGNITANPMFVDTNSANYRLSTNSPCINAGMNMDWMTNAVDRDGRSRIRYGVVDIGAYEIIYGEY